VRIDAHQHFWTYSPQTQAWIDDSMAVLKRDFLPQDLKKELTANSFDGSVVVQAPQTLEETRWLLELADKAPLIKGVVGWVDLKSPDVRNQLKTFAANPKFKGVRHVAQAEPDDRFLLGKEFMEGIAALAEFDLSYDILVFTKQLPAAIELARLFPQQRFVLDHMAKPEIKAGKTQPWKDLIRELAWNPNVYCKLSGMVTEATWKEWSPWHMTPYLDEVFKSFGPQRLMIGSDWPVCLLAGDYGSVVKLVKGYIAEMPKKDQDAVLGGTAEKFYKL
jgi:L-fuconolactonase